MQSQVKKPATVVKFTNQLNTWTEPLDKFMKERKAKQPTVRTAIIGRPCFVQYAKIFGACPRMARPYKIRDEQNRNELPAEKALVKIAALIIDGRTFIPARVKAMT